MAKKMKEPIVVTKIKPYPIAVKLWTNGTLPPLLGDILRITKLGFQMEAQNSLLNIKEQYQLEFTLPFYNKTIRETAQVVKTMDSFKDGKAKVKSYLIELHFVSLSKDHEKAIIEFETAIKQKL